MSYKIKHKKVCVCKFCKSENIVNTIDYLTEIQYISCLNCQAKYNKLGRAMHIVREGVKPNE